MKKAAEVLKAFRDKGFTEIQTGGGCDALYKEVGENVIIITEDDGCNVPETFDCMICVGTYNKAEYDKGNNDDGNYVMFSTSHEYLEDI